jgi:hypothetical protein
MRELYQLCENRGLGVGLSVRTKDDACQPDSVLILKDKQIIYRAVVSSFGACHLSKAIDRASDWVMEWGLV